MNTFQRAGQGARDGEWQAYGGDTGSTKYTALDGINVENVADLEVVWRRPGLDQQYLDINPNQRYTTNWNAAPLIINGVGYVTNGVGLVEAFHPGTGETLWVQEPPGGAEGLPGASTRGVAYWSEGDEQRLFVQRGTFLYALIRQMARHLTILALTVASTCSFSRLNLSDSAGAAFHGGSRCRGNRASDVGHVSEQGSIQGDVHALM